MTDKPSFEKLDFNENPNVGVYCRANEDYAFIQQGLPKKIIKTIETVLEVKAVEFLVANSTILGSLIAVNSKGAVVSNLAESPTMKILDDLGFPIYLCEDVINAAGNDILVNDYGALVHPDLSEDAIDHIHETLQVPIYAGTIADVPTVGMAACVTNKGCLCHPKTSAEDLKMLEEVFNVEVMIGTVNHGDPMIGSGLIANSKGVIIGNRSTGIEMGRIEEALKLYTPKE